MAKVSESRRLVYDILLELEKDPVKADAVIRGELDKHAYMERRDRAFIKRLAEGCIERRISLDHIIGQFSKTPVDKIKIPIKIILRMGIYQIMYMDGVPDAAACNEAVSLCAARGFSGLKGFVNGVLRNVAREKEHIAWPEDPAGYLSTYYSVPRDIVEMFLKDYGEERAKTILEGIMAERPVTVRIREGFDEKELLKSWEEQGIVFRKSPYLERVYSLLESDGLKNMAGYEEGAFYAQDVSAMLAVLAAAPGKDDKLADVCAAPGGKSIMAADLAGKVFAMDVSQARLKLMEENIGRLRPDNIEFSCGDATKPVFEEESMDVVIADVPCSGLGVMGRKADIRYRFDKKKEAELTKLQTAIAEQALKYVKPGGRFIYSTCTINRAENEDIRERLLAGGELESLDIYELIPSALRCESAREGYIQLLPGEPAGSDIVDGFFIAAFRRKGG